MKPARVLNPIVKSFVPKGSTNAVFVYDYRSETKTTEGKSPVLFSHATGFHGRIFDQSIF